MQFKFARFESIFRLVWWFIPFVTAQCTSPQYDRDPQTVFRYNETAAITSLDPAFARSQANIWPVHNMFNRLVQLDNQLRVVPDLADWWQVDSTGTRYLFHIRDDVFFHACAIFGEQKRAVEAADFVYSFQRLRDPKLASPGAWTMDHLDTLYAPSSDTLIIELKQPFAPFLSLLTMEYTAVVPEEVVTHYGADFGRNPVGTGPFQFKLWVNKEKLVLRRNPVYFEQDSAGRALPYLEAIAITFVPDKQSAFLEFLKGNIDFLSGLDASYKDELLTAEGGLNPSYEDRFQLLRSPYLNTEYLGILQEGKPVNHPLSDIRIRRALNEGFNRSEMLTYLRNGIGEPALNGMVPSGFKGFESAEVSVSERGFASAEEIASTRDHSKEHNHKMAILPPNYRPDSARAWIRSWKDQNPDTPLTITLRTNQSYLDLAEFLQHQWGDLGIEVQIDVVPPATLRQMMSSGKALFFRGSWIADYPDPENYLSLFYGPYRAPFGPNYTRTQDDEYDRLYQSAMQASNWSERMAIYQQLNDQITEQVWAIPLYYDEVLRFVPHHLLGMQPNPVNLLDLKRVQKQG